MPRNIRLQDLQNPVGLNGNVESWLGDNNVALNPYSFVMDGNGNKLERDRFQGLLSVTGNICSFLKVTGRIGLDRIADNVENYRTYLNPAEDVKDLITIDNFTREELNADLMLNLNKTFKDFSLTANFGGRIHKEIALCR